jgi:hypothetical protein
MKTPGDLTHDVPYAQPSGSLVFVLNGQRVEVLPGQFDPFMTLSEYLRTKTKYKGTVRRARIV